MNRKDLESLAAVAALHTAKERAKLALQDARFQPLRERLGELAAPPESCGSPTIADARDRAAWEQWRAYERQKLTMELARAETVLRPLRYAAARAVARERVLEEIAKTAPPGRARSGR